MAVSHATPAPELMRPGSNCAASVAADYPMGVMGRVDERAPWCMLPEQHARVLAALAARGSRP